MFDTALGLLNARYGAVMTKHNSGRVKYVLDDGTVRSVSYAIGEDDTDAIRGCIVDYCYKKDDMTVMSMI